MYSQKKALLPRSLNSVESRFFSGLTSLTLTSAAKSRTARGDVPGRGVSEGERSVPEGLLPVHCHYK